MYQSIRLSFYQNWIMNQIKFVEKNYRKLFSIIQNRKMKLLRNQQSNRNFFTLSVEFSSSQLSITSILALVLVFALNLAFASISTRFLIVDQNSVNQKTSKIDIDKHQHKHSNRWINFLISSYVSKTRSHTRRNWSCSRKSIETKISSISQMIILTLRS
jgi:hypothetical protein